MANMSGGTKYSVLTLVLLVVLVGTTFSNLPLSRMPPSVQVVNEVVFNFADYPALQREHIALINYLRELVEQPYGEWEGWHITPDVQYLVHYQLAFMSYAVERMFEVTPGYRTDFYRGLAYDLIKKMNTTIEEYGDTSIEMMEWVRSTIGFPNWTSYHYPDPTNESHVYTGGFRGPANIMWTGHYALMELLYERNFHTGEFYDEFTWFMHDWNNSLTTDGLGHPQEGGIWRCGLIPCQPYAVWVQCNSIPVFFTELYDNMYNTSFRPIWDYGLNFVNTVMQDQYGLFTDCYYVQRPLGYTDQAGMPPQPFPGNELDPYTRDGRPYVSAYGVAWALLFLEYTQPEETVHDYPVFINVCGKDVSGDQMYIMDSYNNPSGFGSYDILACLFTIALAQQRGDLATRDRIMEFLYSPYNQVWSSDGRAMHWDTTAVEPFLQSSLAYGYIWATVPVTVRDMAEPRPAESWDYPYIRSADDDSIWVYQAVWDPEKEGFVLTVEVDETATLEFANFDHTPTAYSGGVPLAGLTATGDGYALTLEPGTYHIVIV